MQRDDIFTFINSYSYLLDIIVFTLVAQGSIGIHSSSVLIVFITVTLTISIAVVVGHGTWLEYPGYIYRTLCFYVVN